MTALYFSHKQASVSPLSGVVRLLKTVRRAFFTSLSEPTADLVDQANQARDQRDWPAAARLYQLALKQSDTNSALRVQLGHALKESGDFAGAEAAYRAYLEVKPDDADIYLQFGHLFNRRNEPADALIWYKIAAAMAPSDADIKQHLETCTKRIEHLRDEASREQAFDLIRRSSWSAARALLQDLVANGRNYDLIGILANVTKECGAFEEAEVLYAEYRTYAREKAPDLQGDGELQTGHLHQAAGQLDKALSHYILARHHDFEREGYLPDDATSDREVRSCVKQIYTCFWDCKSA